MHHILVVDDDRVHVKMLDFLLTDEGYKVSTATGPSSALALLEQETYDLIFLDILMPGGNGLELGRRIRETSTTPIIFISSLREVQDRINGLQAGGDDYITKPFDPNEMLARAWAILRRNRLLANSESNLKTPDFHLNPIDNEVTLVRSGKKVSLTPIEARLLRVLASNPGRTLTRDMIIVKVWGYEYEGESNQLDVYIKRLRSKIEEIASTPKLLITIRGVGYRYQPSTPRPESTWIQTPDASTPRPESTWIQTPDASTVESTA